MIAHSSTGSKVLAALDRFNPKEHPAGEFRLKGSPFREGSDSGAFTITIAPDGEHGAFHDFTNEDKGSLYELAIRLDIEPPRKRDRKPVETTKRKYEDMADYALAHGLTSEALIAASWTQTVYKGRPALEFDTANGVRWRYLDGGDQSYDSPHGYKKCWYGLYKALSVIDKAPQPLVICNGEISTIAAIHHRVAACCITAGEAPSMPPHLLAEFKLAYDDEVIVAYDCDTAGREKGVKLAQFLIQNGINAKAVDLMLGDKGDIADLCKLFTTDAAARLQTLPVLWPLPGLDAKKPIEPPPSITTWDTAAARADDLFLSRITGDVYEPIPIPFQNICQFGGLAEMLEPGKVLAVMADSGVGKTSFIESMVDHWRRDGFAGVMWGPEWDALAYVLRAIQRAGGPSYSASMMHRTYDSSKRNGRTGAQLRGRPLSPELVEAGQRLNDEIRQWPGTLQFVEKMALTVGGVIVAMKQLVDFVEPDKRIAFAVCDYAQLLSGEKNTESVDSHLRSFKEFCVDYKLVGVVGSQVTKTAGVVSASGGRLAQQSGQFVRGDYFNLIITIGRELDNTGHMSELAKVAVAKNSLGGMGDTVLIQNLKTMAWQDTTKLNIDTGASVAYPTQEEVPF